MSSDWEVFASMIVNDLGRKLGAGIDLANNEVKSAKQGGSYEYQYHKNTGKEKLAKDMAVGHLFFEYSDNLEEVHLRWLHGSTLKSQFFQKWLDEYPDPYPQRYRRNVRYSFVKRHGTLLMTLRSGEVIFPELSIQIAPKVVEGDSEGTTED